MSEIVFMVYALGFTLEKVAAMQEHGIKGSSFTFRIYEFVLTPLEFILRVHGFVI